MVLGLSTFAACGGDSFADECASGCEEADCDGNEPSAAEVTSCQNACDDAVALNEKAGCNDQADELASCGGDACSDEANAECQSASSAYVSCIVAFCTQNPNDTDCAL